MPWCHAAGDRKSLVMLNFAGAVLGKENHFVKDLTGEQIVAKIKREQMVAKRKGVYDYAKTILWEHCYNYRYTFVGSKYRLYAMGIFKPDGNPKMGYDYPTLYPASWRTVVFCECP